MIKRLKLRWQQDLYYCTLSELQGNSDRTVVHGVFPFEKSNYPHCFYNVTRCYPAFAAVKSFVLKPLFYTLRVLESLGVCTLSFNRLQKWGAASAAIKPTIIVIYISITDSFLTVDFRDVYGNVKLIQSWDYIHKERPNFISFIFPGEKIFVCLFV